MKILMLTDYFFPHISGGVEKVVLELSKNLVNSGYEVCVLTLNTTNSEQDEKIQGIRVVRVKAYDLTKLFGLQSAFSISLFFHAKKLIKEFHPDIIHLHNRFFFTTFIGIFLRKHFQLPTLVTLHTGPIDYIGGIKGYFIKKLEKFMIRLINNNSSLVTAVGKTVKDNAIRLGITSNKCRIISNGVNISHFKVLRSNEKKPLKIIFIGRLISNKGPQILVESAKTIIKKFSDIQFLIVGDGPLRRSLEQYCEKNNLSTYIKFLGQKEDIREILKEGDLYVRPSYADGFPLGVLEAMAAELPVLAAKNSGTMEIIQHGKTGYLVNPGNVEELSQGIYEMLMNPSYMKKVAKNGLQFVKSKYDWANICTEYKKCYEEILSK